MRFQRGDTTSLDSGEVDVERKATASSTMVEAGNRTQQGREMARGAWRVWRQFNGASGDDSRIYRCGD